MICGTNISLGYGWKQVKNKERNNKDKECLF